MTHTPEPWLAYTDNEGITEIITAGDYPLVILPGLRNSSYDMNRIVACVNACAGVDTVTLENFARGYPTVWDMVREFKQQNAELLAALEEIAEYPRKRGHEFTAAGLRSVAREAIAKAAPSSGFAPPRPTKPYPKPAIKGLT